MKKFIAFLLSSVLAFTIAMPSFAASPRFFRYYTIYN